MDWSVGLGYCPLVLDCPLRSRVVRQCNRGRQNALYLGRRGVHATGDGASRFLSQRCCLGGQQHPAPQRDTGSRGQRATAGHSDYFTLSAVPTNLHRYVLYL